MLAEIGKSQIDDLFVDIPKAFRLNRALDLEASKSELEIQKNMRSLAGQNTSLDDLVCFMGAGAYDHFVPTVVNHLAGRSEFFTAYTPYQPEISQGTLQNIFEYQSLICELTGMDVSNASVYDGAHAAAEAAMMACAAKKRDKILVSASVHPEVRQVLKTYYRFRDYEVVEVPIEGGETDYAALENLIDKSVAGVMIQSPNFFGIVEDIAGVSKQMEAVKGLTIVSVDPISLALLEPPGNLGADIVIGEGQVLGNDIALGGPYFGFMAVTQKLVRKLPGRICGQSVDEDGKRAFVLTLQAREQHLKDVAEHSLQKAHYLYNQLIEKGLAKPAFEKPFFKEFAVTFDKPVELLNGELLKAGILGGYDVNRVYPMPNTMLLAVTEKRTKEEMDALVKALEVIL
jgi:glycine dehydrogenase subunit 1